MQALGMIETRGLIAAIESADAMLKAAEVNLLEKTYVGGGLVSIAVTGGVAAVKAAVEAGAAAVEQINATLLVSQHVIPRPNEEITELIKPTKPPVKEEIQSVEGFDSVVEENETGNLLRKSSVVDFIKNSTSEDTLSEDSMTSSKADVFTTVIAENITEDRTEAMIEAMTEAETEAMTEAETVDMTEAEIEDMTQVITTIRTEVEQSTQNQEVTEAIPEEIQLEVINKAGIDKLVQEYSVEKALEFLSGLKVVKLRNLARAYTNLKISGRTISKADKKKLLIEFEEYYKKNQDNEKGGIN